GRAAARPLPAAPFRRRRLPPRARGARARGLSLRALVVRHALRVPLPEDRRSGAARDRDRAAPRDRALARARRGARRKWYRALRGFVAGTPPGARAWAALGAHRARLQRPPPAAPSHRAARRVRGRSALPRVAAAVVSAPDDPRPYAARVRRDRRSRRPVSRRMHLSR